MNEVWIIAEQRAGRLMNVSLELLNKANELASALKVKSGVVLLGDGIRQMADELASYADRVYLVDSPELRFYQGLSYTDLVTGLIAEHEPDIVLTGSTPIGQDLAPRIAARLRTGLTAHCADLYIKYDGDKPLLAQVVPGWGGNMLLEITCPRKRPQMATVSPGMMPRCESREHKGEVISIQPEIASDARIETLEMFEESTPEKPLEDAEIVVAGGWGLASSGFSLVRELAEVLGGAVAGTRPAVDSGWLEKQKMVGQSGITIRPRLFISVGASGAPQFTIGFTGAKVVMAIDQNRNAPIFETADIGLVGDAGKIVPCLITALKNSTLCR